MTPSMRDRWDDYRKKVIPPQASNTQITECRRAFYAGAEALLSLFKTIDPSQEVGQRKLDDITEELQKFRRDVTSGLA